MTKNLRENSRLLNYIFDGNGKWLLRAQHLSEWRTVRRIAEVGIDFALQAPLAEQIRPEVSGNDIWRDGRRCLQRFLILRCPDH